MASFLDEAALDELLRKVLTAEPANSKAPLSQGLIAAGAQMLANSHRGLPGALGAGGMGFLEASNAERQRQAKDPMQQLQMAQTVMGIQGNLQNQRAQREYQQAMTPTAGQAQPGGPPPLEVLMRFASSPNKDIAERSMTAIKTFYPQFDLSPGQTRYGNSGQPIAQNVDPTKPVLQGNQYGFAPGALESMTQQKRQEAEATAAANARYQPVQTSQGGVPVTTTAAQLAASQGGGLPPGMEAAYADYLKGDTSKPFQFTYTPPKARLGVGISKAQEAADVQAATMPGAMSQSLAEGMQKYSIENLSVGHKAAEEAAYNELPAIRDVRERIASGAFAGGGAETKTAILNQINGWFGTSIASPQVAQSQALNSALGKQLLANAKKLGANPTEADSKRIDNIVGKQGLSPEALLIIAEVQEKMAKQAIERHNKRLDSMESALKERGMPADVITSLRVKAPEMESVKPKSSGNPTLDAIEAEILRRRGR